MNSSTKALCFVEEFNFCRYLSTKEVSSVDAKRPEETFVLILAQFCGRTAQFYRKSRVNPSLFHLVWKEVEFFFRIFRGASKAVVAQTFRCPCIWIDYLFHFLSFYNKTTRYLHLPVRPAYLSRSFLEDMQCGHGIFPEDAS